MSLLIIGATGTLGRQIAKKALDKGFQVKCLVRNIHKALFLKEWGAELIYGDLNISDTIPKTLYGITAIIDASTSRPHDFCKTKQIDLEGKFVLIDSAEKASIRRYIFFSILYADDYINIPLMHFKKQIENRLINSTINYTIFNLCGFFQGVISQYALPILDNRSIWITDKLISIAYIDTQDVARFTIQSLSIPSMENRAIPLIGKKGWNSHEIIMICKKLSGQKPKIAFISLKLLQITCYFTRLFQWSWKISERLTFIQIINKNKNFNIDEAYMQDICLQLGSDREEVMSLEAYLQEYFYRVMKRLKTLDYPLKDAGNKF